MLQLRKSIEGGGNTQFRGYGDLSLTEILPALLTRYSETEMMIVAPSVPDQAAEIIRRWMKRQWARMDGRGQLDVIAKLTIVADLSEEKSPLASSWLKDNPFDGRLVLADRAQTDTALLLPDLAVTGPLNMRYGHTFICRVTADKDDVDALWKQYMRLAKTAARKTRKTVGRQDDSEAAETVQEPVIEPAAEAPAAEEPVVTEPADEMPEAAEKEETGE